jgi:hypothetical protein
MRPTLILLCLLLSTASVFAKKRAASPRVNGIYQTAMRIDKDGDTSYSYLRFYKDGQVLSVTSTGSPGDLRAWFHLKMANPSVGVYKLKGRNISFPTTNKQGTVLYEGRMIDKDHLDLHLKSLINGYQHQEQYFFVAVDGLQ